MSHSTKGLQPNTMIFGRSCPYINVGYCYLSVVCIAYPNYWHCANSFCRSGTRQRSRYIRCSMIASPIVTGLPYCLGAHLTPRPPVFYKDVRLDTHLLRDGVSYQTFVRHVIFSTHQHLSTSLFVYLLEKTVL
jgi:hypothetical protein